MTGPPEPAKPVPGDGCGALRPFDGNEIYLLGTLEEGSSGRDAIAHWSDPNHALGGFPSPIDYASAVINPGDGTLMYTGIFDPAIRRFREDACFVNEYRGYPMAPELNDDVVMHPCGEQTAYQPFEVSPDGEIALYCGGPWTTPEGTVLYGGGAEVLSFGHSRALLTRRGVFSIDGQAFHPFAGLPDFGERDPVAVRATFDGFWIVLIGPESFDEHDLWWVDFNGVATYVGRYASRSNSSLGADGFALAADGALYDLLYDIDAFHMIERRTLSGTQIVYSERDAPLVKMHISGLVTGP